MKKKALFFIFLHIIYSTRFCGAFYVDKALLSMYS